MIPTKYLFVGYLGLGQLGTIWSHSPNDNIMTLSGFFCTNSIHLVQLEKMKQSGRYASPRRTRSKGSPISSTHSSRKGSPSRSPQPEAEGADAAGRKGSILTNSTFYFKS